MSDRTTDPGVTALITEQPLDPVAAQQMAWSPACGAVVVFSGIVRNHDAGQHVDSLNYSAHPSAEAVLHQVATRVAAAHPGVRIWVGHRVGALRVGDHALVAACASAHRAESFAACEALIEQIKSEVPIWKEQFYADGTRHWVGMNDVS